MTHVGLQRHSKKIYIYIKDTEFLHYIHVYTNVILRSLCITHHQVLLWT